MALAELEHLMETRQPMSYEENVQYDLYHNTKEEVRQKYNLTTKEFNKLIKENSLEVPYEYRTPISNTLLPIESELNKYFKNGKRAKNYNKLHELCNERKWIESETKTRNETKEEHEAQLGFLLAQLEGINTQINQQLKHISYQKFIIDVINKLGNEDYIGIIAEEQYGKYDVPEHFSNNLLTDTVIFSYLNQKYGILKASEVFEILRKD